MQPNPNLNKLIRDRYSPIIFQDKPIEPEKVELLFEAARWAPSSYNEQPWRYFAGVKGTNAWQQIFDLLAEGNQTWTKDVPFLVISVASMKYAKNDKDNRHGYHDTGMATENLVLQATDLGLHVHQMGGFDEVKAAEVFELPPDFEAVAVAAIGYKGDEADLTGDMKERADDPRTRRELSETVFEGTFGNAFKF